MTDFQKTCINIFAVCVIPLLVTACGGEQKVSFSEDVQPILEQHCVQCHQPGGQGELASGLDMTSYEGLMKGTRNGPMVIAGDTEGSNLLVLVEGRADPSIKMPHGNNQPLAKADIETIRSWIGQGAKNN
ncbi:MAG: c-type cytochrome domain-containing protein [Lysobacterales bacterium]